MLMWKFVGVSKVSILYIYIYILEDGAKCSKWSPCCMLVEKYLPIYNCVIQFSTLSIIYLRA